MRTLTTLETLQRSTWGLDGLWPFLPPRHCFVLASVLPPLFFPLPTFRLLSCLICCNLCFHLFSETQHRHPEPTPRDAMAAVDPVTRKKVLRVIAVSLLLDLVSFLYTAGHCVLHSLIMPINRSPLPLSCRCSPSSSSSTATMKPPLSRPRARQPFYNRFSAVSTGTRLPSPDP